ncbi:tail fiber protein [Stenotrophomonas phage vB_SmaS_DLP_5]|uniref:Tail fiber protein n=1 Tax=Stenotrophomonas phage vB_SmaS_DLP_5 TaxID=2044561 RepID=A0A2D2W2D1_9CAUD|nr:tail fiber protein [Stenotrophomonas phage vB_SmaS_DLP_5]ATS92293.1 tail fiber protein [Stenotrophomonas phage vB_SmaS_DLP_5]
MLLVDLPLTSPEGTSTYADATGRFWTGYSTPPKIIGGALTLDGSGLIYTNSGTDFVLGLKDYDIKFDVNTTSTTLSTVVDYLYGGYTTWQIYFSTDGRLIWTAEGPNESPVIASDPINDGNWHTVLFQRRNGILSVIVDDVVQASVPHGRSYKDQLSTFAFGGRWYLGYSNLFTGKLRNFRVETFDPPLAPIKALHTPPKMYIGWDKPVIVGGPKIGFEYPLLPLTTKKPKAVQITRGVPPWWGPSDSTKVLPTYRLRGRVMQRDPDTGTDYPVMNAQVALFYRKLHTLIDIKLSNAQGYVEFKNLMPGQGAYYAIAFDPDGGPIQNAVIWDQLSSEP